MDENGKIENRKMGFGNLTIGLTCLFI